MPSDSDRLELPQPIGADGTVLTADATAPKGVAWAPPATELPQPIGADGTVLTADSLAPDGVAWAPPAGGGSETVLSVERGSNLNSSMGSWADIGLTLAPVIGAVTDVLEFAASVPLDRDVLDVGTALAYSFDGGVTLVFADARYLHWDYDCLRAAIRQTGLAPGAKSISWWIWASGNVIVLGGAATAIGASARARATCTVRSW